MNRPHFSLRNQHGTTLVELLVVTGLFVIVGGLAIGFFLSAFTGGAKAKANIEAQENARFAMQRVVYEIRRSRGIEVTSDFGVNLATTSGTTLDLDMTDALRDPTTFQVAGGVLQMQQGTGGFVDLTSDDVTVTNLTFDNRTTGNGRSRHIKMILTVTHPDPTGAEAIEIVYTLQTTVELRDR